MNIVTLPIGVYVSNCSLVWEDPAKIWIIDPGSEAERILAEIKRNRLTGCSQIILTHGHFDHISSVNEILEAFPGVPVHLHPADLKMAFSPLNSVPFCYPQTRKPETLVTDLTDGALLSADGMSMEVIHTPGHTPGSCCLYFREEKVLFSGDTLFQGSIGRTDFPGGSMSEMSRSLNRLKELPDDLKVIPGHGGVTTIGAEKRENPYLTYPDF